MPEDPTVAASDSDRSPDENGTQFKRRRRLHGACDSCKRKKTKCDSAIMPNNICSNCTSANLECTRTIPRQKKRDRQQEYIVQLEEKIRSMEELLKSKSVDTPSACGESSRRSSPSTSSVAPGDLAAPIPQTLRSSRSSKASSPERSDDEHWEEYEPTSGVTRILGSLSINCREERYFGKSSILSLASQAVSVKTEFAGDVDLTSAAAVRRPPFWVLRPWEREFINAPELAHVFPEPDLLDKLLAAYWEWIHPQFPVVHRPSFMRDIQNNRHFGDTLFGMVLLGVCAAASRFVDDDRVLIVDYEHPEQSGPSAGWRFFKQTTLIRRSIIESATLMDLQYYTLIVFYFLGTSTPQTGWILLGMVMRLVIEKGYHRRKGSTPTSGVKPKGQEELEKRVFWSLLSLEWLTSSSFGRPSCLHDEDIDVEFPLEVDDEYWDTEVDDPTKAFVQPPEKPSMLTGTIAHYRLCEIAAFTIRTLYSTKKSKILTGSIGEEWERQIVSQLDSAMNSWKDGLPEHLRWDPRTPNSEHFTQQASLHAAYYYLQIQIHRPFLRTKTSLSFPALAICTNAARACGNLAEACVQRHKFSTMIIFGATFAASTVLAINMWGRQSIEDRRRQQADINKLVRLLKMGEQRWHIAGRFVDMITEFCALNDPSMAKKRPRSFDFTSDPTFHQPGPPQERRPTWQASVPPGPQASRNPQPGGEGFHFDDTLLPPNHEVDLDSFLRSHIDYSRDLQPTSSHYSSSNHPQHGTFANWQDPSTGVGANESQMFMTGFESSGSLEVPDLSAMSIWMSAPPAFGIEEWDSYLASFNHQPGLQPEGSMGL